MNKVAILVGSVYGAAEELGEYIAGELADNTITQVFTDAALADVLSYAPTVWVVVTSTTGLGDIPDNLLGLFEEMKTEFPDLSHAKYAVVAMGDSTYVDSYCGAGKKFDELLKQLTAKPLQDRLEIDACETMDPVDYAQGWVKDLAVNID
ncbi:hypothetical protein C2869_14885 [Saccharobesus litoralis]|uniref:Flavodoxin-like domain-containing protein n=1 Tax=Saccharobesus litoralis TaxID=2172099 RepID=A0A2S0VTZ2_9ALTE|nr:flavodoxin domain-containing protein [Saccharobesus litoralis]AWB67642.1 hypothetical protein C2869_14885 [Saccharobesus litoralis]